MRSFYFFCFVVAVVSTHLGYASLHNQLEKCAADTQALTQAAEKLQQQAKIFLPQGEFGECLAIVESIIALRNEVALKKAESQGTRDLIKSLVKSLVAFGLSLTPEERWNLFLDKLEGSWKDRFLDMNPPSELTEISEAEKLLISQLTFTEGRELFLAFLATRNIELQLPGTIMQIKLQLMLEEAKLKGQKLELQVESEVSKCY